MDVGDAYEVIEVDVAESSEVLCVAIDQPLGITFEGALAARFFPSAFALRKGLHQFQYSVISCPLSAEIEGDIVADEIAEDSNAALAKVSCNAAPAFPFLLNGAAMRHEIYQ